MDNDALYRLGGITGLGWTVSLLGYLVTVVGHENRLVAGVVAEPQALLYLGGVLFVATLGLDRLRTRGSHRER